MMKKSGIKRPVAKKEKLSITKRNDTLVHLIFSCQAHGTVHTPANNIIFHFVFFHFELSNTVMSSSILICIFFILLKINTPTW